METRKIIQISETLYLRAMMLLMLVFVVSFSAKAIETYITLTDGQSYSNTIDLKPGDVLTIEVKGGNKARITGTVKGRGMIVKVGTGSLSIEKDNTSYTGTVEVKEGSLYIGTFDGDIKTGNLAGTIFLYKSTKLCVFRSRSVYSTITLEAEIHGFGNVEVFSGGKKLIFDKFYTYEGSTTIHNATTLQLEGVSGISQSSQVVLMDNTSKFDISGASGSNRSIRNLRSTEPNSEIILGDKILKIFSDNSTTFAGKFTGKGIVEKRGAATLTLSGTNTHTGGLDIYDGTIVFDKLANLGKGLLWIAPISTLKWANNCTVDPSSLFTDGLSGGTFDIGNNNVTMSSPIKNYNTTSFDLRKKGSGQLYLSANNPYMGKFIVEEGELNLGKGGSTGNIAADIELKSGTTLYFWKNGGSSTTYDGVISGAGRVLFTNTNNETVAPKYYLTKAQTYTGSTQINVAELYLTGNANLASSSLLSLNRATSRFDISGVTKDVSVKTLESTQTGATVNLGSKSLWVGVNNSTGTFSYSGKILGNGALYKTYPGKFIFKGTHSGTGHLYLVQGTLELASDWQGDADVGTGDLVVTGNRTIKGKLTFYSGVKTHFDLTANPRSKLTANGGVYNSGGASTLSVKCNTVGGYDLIEGSGVSTNNFNLEMTGSWKNGELKVSGNKLQLVEATDNIAPTVSNKTITIDNFTHNSIKVSWAKATDNKTTQANLEYEVTYKEGSNTQSMGWKKNINTATITGLKAETSYTINVTVRDEAGNKTNYTAKTQKTKEAADNTAPTVSNKTLTIVAFTHNSIKVSWAKATDNKTTQANLEYEVTYKEGSNSQSMGWKKNINEAVLSGLKSDTEYTLNVTVRDEAGNQTSYTAKTQKTKEAADNTAPTVSNKTITIDAFTHNSIKLSWTKASDNKTSQANLEYEVTYKEGSNTQSMGWKKNIDEATITGLKAETSYTINVTVRDEAGNQTSYTAKTQKTKEAADTEAPTIANKTITVGEVTDKSIEISWTKASDNKTAEANLEYEVTYKEGSNTQSMGWKKNINEATITGLKAETSYTINVTVRDEAGNENSYEELKVTTLPYTGIETLEAMGIHIWSSKSVLHITLPQAELIELFDISGALVYAESDAVGDIRIALKSGVYIVRIKGVTVKTIVR